MTGYFLDTSSLVKRYVVETGSAWLTALTDVGAGNACWISAITRVEFAAALYRRVRIGTLALVQAQQTELVFRHELPTHFRSIPADTAILDQAMQLVAVHPLRASDAIQLATAVYIKDQYAAVGLPPPVLVSSDHDLNQAATAEGLVVDDPNLHP